MRIVRDFILPILLAVAIYALLHVSVASFKVYGTSMMPTIRPEEYIMVSKAAYFFGQPERGDVVVLSSPNEADKDLIKRIIGLPGDTIEIKNRTVFVNGKPVVEPYIAEPPNYAFPQTQMPDGQYFLLGDNRNHSADCHLGWTVPRQNIIGKAWITYWPPYLWGAIENYPLLASKQPVGLIEPSLTTGMLCLTR